MNKDDPRYGYGKGRRPLWSPRDRDAEAIRRVLRRAGLLDFDERHLDGFAVEGANVSSDGPEPFTVAYCGDVDRPAAMLRYARALERAGYRVGPDPLDQDVLLVQRQLTRARPGQRLLTVAVVCAVVATVALVASFAGTGAVKFTGGVGSAVFGVLAVFLAGLWYQRQIDAQTA